MDNWTIPTNPIAFTGCHRVPSKFNSNRVRMHYFYQTMSGKRSAATKESDGSTVTALIRRRDFVACDRGVDREHILDHLP